MKSCPHISLLLLVLVSAQVACLGYTTMHTARPVAPGSLEVGVGLMGVFWQLPKPPFEDDLTAPGLELNLRYGMSEFLDLGIKYSTVQPFAATFDANFALVNTGDFALSVDPTVSPFLFTADETELYALTVLLPVIVDVYSTDDFVVSASVRGGYLYGQLSGETEDDLSLLLTGDFWGLGGGLGAKIRINEYFGVMPEATVLYWWDMDSVAWTFGTNVFF